jgi:phosphoglycerol transferase MdoB-like AlkP superfamily enzyme
MPHAPYAFRHDGKKLAMSEYMSFRKDDKALYLEQLRYANLLIAQIAQQLSNKDAVVIIQGDHGFRHLRGANQQEESFMILNAVKPALAKAYSFPSHMTPVNAFRVILNNEFGASIPLLKDSIIPE